MAALFALTRMTVADGLRQPTTWLMTGLSVSLLLLGYLFGHFTFDEEDRMRMLATAGVAAATLNGLFLAVYGASQTVHDELASRTALTLFAKPMGRGTYLLGKALGVWIVVAVAAVVIVAIHAAFLSMGGATGFRELFPSGGHGHATMDAVPVPWGPVLVAHVLALGHGAIMACLATVLSLRVPLVANILLCFAIFVGGHVLAGFGFSGALVLPALNLFNVDDSIQLVGKPVSGLYVLSSGLYTLLFCAGYLALGTVLFERQDIP